MRDPAKILLKATGLERCVPIENFMYNPKGILGCLKSIDASLPVGSSKNQIAEGQAGKQLLCRMVAMSLTVISIFRKGLQRPSSQRTEKQGQNS